MSDPAGNRTRAAGLEGRDFTDHATATDSTICLLNQNRYWIAKVMQGLRTPDGSGTNTLFA